MNSTNNQRGFMQVVAIVLVLVGIAGGAYLVQQKTNFFPKAAEPKVERPQVKDNAQKQAQQEKSTLEQSSASANTDVDLGSSLKELDDIKTNDVELNLSQNELDAAQF